MSRAFTTSRSRRCRECCWTSRRSWRRSSSPGPATRPGSAIAPRPAHVEACIARNPRKPGASKLRRALGADVTLSALEDGFLELLDRHRLPTPRTNIDHCGDKVDCRWPEHDLTVELLSYRFHASRRAFEADVARRRRSDHVAFTYGDVFERSAGTAAELERRLRRSAA